MKFTILVLMLFSAMAFAGDPRYCEGPILRDAKGKIKRSSAAIREFRSWHPCPSTLLTTGPCPGWAIDHPIPLGVGGCDVAWNMQWLPDEIKSNRKVQCKDCCKDCWELKVYRQKPPIDAPQPAPLVVLSDSEP